jgi:hypothetical protein
MSTDRKLCTICAWRKDCKKKFSLGEGKLNCPDFAKDLKLKKEPNKKNEK